MPQNHGQVVCQGKIFGASPWAEYLGTGIMAVSERAHWHNALTLIMHASFLTLHQSVSQPKGHLNTHLLQNIYKQLPAIFSETNHNPLCLPSCLHKLDKFHEATGVLNRVDPSNIQAMQIKSPNGKNRKKKKFRSWWYSKKMFLDVLFSREGVLDSWGGHTLWLLGLPPGSALRYDSWWCLGDPMEC